MVGKAGAAVSKGFDGWQNYYFDPEYDDDEMEECPQCRTYGVYQDTNEFGDGEAGDYVLVFRCANCGYSWLERIPAYEVVEVELGDF